MRATRLLGGLAVTTAVVTAGGYGYARTMRPQLELGVGYAARVACGCRYIGNRSIGDCRKDFEPGMQLIRLSEDRDRRTVTASVPLIAHRTVRFDPLLGCQPEAFAGKPHTMTY